MKADRGRGQMLNITCTTCKGSPADHPYYYGHVNDVSPSTLMWACACLHTVQRACARLSVWVS